ncbi:MAG: RagB/SusD family nutrient uptake outer membrane protein [Bernardetiaceae bacterium]
MKNIHLVFLLLALALAGCQIDEQVDPNRPSLNSVLSNASRAELNNLVIGIQAEMRSGLGTYAASTGTIARELYLFNADPRNLQDLVGLDGRQLDNNTFYLTNIYNPRYRVIKNCNILFEALDNSAAVSEAEKQGYRGFANTMKAHELLLVLNLLDENGIRVSVADPDNLGSFVSKSEALTEIARLLEEGNTQLGAASDAFGFPLSSGFAGFDTPATFRRFNRALAARVALYREDWSGALALLNASFFALNGDMSLGPKHVFSTAGQDQLNPVFRIPDQNGDQIIVNNAHITGAETGDLRISGKTAPRLNPTGQGGFNGTHESRLYANAVAPISIIRNEELHLIYAEANIQLGNFAAALTGLNAVRTSAGLNAYSGPQNREALIDQMLQERRYSLFSEGHRMIDLRRYGRLNAENVPVDPNLNPDTGQTRSQTVFLRFPIPLAENP